MSWPRAGTKCSRTLMDRSRAWMNRSPARMNSFSKLEHDATPSNGASVTRMITFRRGALGNRPSLGERTVRGVFCSRSAAAVRPGQIIASRASSLVRLSQKPSSRRNRGHLQHVWLGRRRAAAAALSPELKQLLPVDGARSQPQDKESSSSRRARNKWPALLPKFPNRTCGPRISATADCASRCRRTRRRKQPQAEK
jgi:hypothetical protein